MNISINQNIMPHFIDSQRALFPDKQEIHYGWDLGDWCYILDKKIDTIIDFSDYTPQYNIGFIIENVGDKLVKVRYELQRIGKSKNDYVTVESIFEKNVRVFISIDDLNNYLNHYFDDSKCDDCKFNRYRDVQLNCSMCIYYNENKCKLMQQKYGIIYFKFQKNFICRYFKPKTFFYAIPIQRNLNPPKYGLDIESYKDFVFGDFYKSYVLCHYGGTRKSCCFIKDKATGNTLDFRKELNVKYPFIFISNTLPNVKIRTNIYLSDFIAFKIPIRRYFYIYHIYITGDSHTYQNGYKKTFERKVPINQDMTMGQAKKLVENLLKNGE